MGCWNHRVVKRVFPNGEEELSIHEAHYDKEWGKPRAWTTQPVAVSADSIKDLRWTLKQMLKALDQPVIDGSASIKMAPACIKRKKK